MKITRPWYGVVLRIAVTPIVLLLITIEQSAECVRSIAFKWVDYIDETLP